MDFLASHLVVPRRVSPWMEFQDGTGELTLTRYASFADQGPGLELPLDRVDSGLKGGMVGSSETPKGRISPPLFSSSTYFSASSKLLN